jgi:hypothetical protein
MKQMDIPAEELKMPRSPDLGWREHPIRGGDGKGGWRYQQGEYQFLHAERDVPAALIRWKP